MIVTRCPHCSTTFRVTPEQLKFRDGLVRCGHCFASFDALAELVGESASAAPPIRPATPAVFDALPVPPVADNEAHPTQAPQPPVVDVQPTVPEPELMEEMPAAPAPEPVPEPLPASEATDTATPEEASEPEARATGTLSRESGTEPTTAFSPSPQPPSEPAAESTPPSEPPPKLPRIPAAAENVTTAPKRWLWLLAAALGLMVLLAQAAMHFRTELAVRLPGGRPALEAVCEQFGCEVGLPSRIELLEIEHSDLVPDEKQPGRLQLSATLRNRGTHAQNWPHLEVTLTDASDRALTRRALAPRDYLPSADMVAAGFAARAEQHVRLDLATADVPAIGYRLYLFYP